MIYFPLLVNRFQKSILLIVQYKYSKSCSGDLILQNLSTQDHAELVLLLNLIVFFVSARTKWWAEIFCSIEVPAL